MKMNVLTYQVSIGIGFLTVHEIDSENTLQSMYDLLDCSMVDVRRFELDGHVYDVWFDEEFFINGKDIIPTVLLGKKEGWASEVLICGNVMYARSNEEGETIGLTDEDIQRLKDFQYETAPKAVRYYNKMRARA